jgi:hypothetical protein
MNQHAKKRPRTLASVAALLVLAAGAVGGLFAISAGAERTHVGSTPIHVVELPTHLNYISVGKLAGKTGPSQGDYEAYDDALVKPGTKQVVGHITGLCYLVNPTAGPGLYNCWADWALPQGQIVAMGLVPLAGKGFAAPIVGGLGAYANAHGQVKATFMANSLVDWVLTPTS